MALTKDEIIAAIAARSTEVKTVDVPEWGGEVNIRLLSAADLDATGMLSQGDEQSAETMLKVLAVSLCDDEGTPLFDIDELRELEAADAVVASKLFAECARFNGLLTEDVAEAEAVFGDAPRDGSSTD